MNDGGCVETARCECPRGQYKCHHMAALLMYGNKNFGCTDKPCVWKGKKKPTDRGGETRNVNEMYPSSKPNFKAMDRAVTEDDRKWFLQELQKFGEPVGFTWLLATDPAPDKLVVPTIDSIVISKEFIDSPNKVGYVLQTMEVQPCMINVLPH